MKLVTFNLRVGFWGTNDKINGYIHRSGMIAYKVNEEKPDIICFQEITSQVLPHLRIMLRDYDIFYNSREESLGGEGLAIALRKGEAELVGLDAFWLSPTPRVAASRYECSSQYPRICQYAVVRLIKENKLFRLYNNHFDHASEESRRVQIAQVIDFIVKKQQENNLPFAITGDFNAPPHHESIQQFANCEKVRMVDVSASLTHSFHAYGKYTDGHKIDYIYTDEATAKVTGAPVLWDTTRNGIFLSDHYPICVEIDL